MTRLRVEKLLAMLSFARPTTFQSAKRNLGILWILGSAPILLLFLAQIVGGFALYRDFGEALGLLSPNFLPFLTLSLMVMLKSHKNKRNQELMGAYGIYWTSMIISGIQILLVWIVVLAVPRIDRDPTEMIRDASKVMVYFQGITAGVIGAFYESNVNR